MFKTPCWWSEFDIFQRPVVVLFSWKFCTSWHGMTRLYIVVGASQAHARLLYLIMAMMVLLFQDAALQCKAYMERDPDNINFTIVALAASDWIYEIWNSFILKIKSWGDLKYHILFRNCTEILGPKCKLKYAVFAPCIAFFARKIQAFSAVEFEESPGDLHSWIDLTADRVDFTWQLCLPTTAHAS